MFLILVLEFSKLSFIRSVSSRVHTISMPRVILGQCKPWEYFGQLESVASRGYW